MIWLVPFIIWDCFQFLELSHFRLGDGSKSQKNRTQTFNNLENITKRKKESCVIKTYPKALSTRSPSNSPKAICPLQLSSKLVNSISHLLIQYRSKTSPIKKSPSPICDKMKTSWYQSKAEKAIHRKVPVTANSYPKRKRIKRLLIRTFLRKSPYSKSVTWISPSWPSKIKISNLLSSSKAEKLQSSPTIQESWRKPKAPKTIPWFKVESIPDPKKLSCTIQQKTVEKIFSWEQRASTL